MEAKARSFTFLSNEGLVRIPLFQRGYVWEETNWDDLLTDLFKTKGSHFLGSIILKQQDSGSGETKEVLVIDGQQRLTTLSILLKALYDTFTDTLKENCRDSGIRNHLFRKVVHTDKEYLVKIQHSHADYDAYQKVIRAGIDDNPLEIPNDTQNRIFICYRYFHDKLMNEPEGKRVNLFNNILNPENKMLVIIDLTEKDEEQEIFDTLNTAGVRLSPADIVKNALFQRAIKLLPTPEKAIALYEETWEKVFLPDEETIRFWESERVTGRLSRDTIEILLHSIAVIKGFYDPVNDTLSELSKRYKKEIAELESQENLNEFINEIKDYAGIYRGKILPCEADTLYSFSDEIQRLLHILDVLQISTFHPFILYVLKTKSNDIPYITRVLSRLEKFVIRRMMAKQEIKSYNKLCKEFIQNPDLLTEKLKETTDEQIAAGLKNISNKNASLLLFWIELYRRSKDKKTSLKELKFSYSLEHIMPQKWEEYWKEMPEKKNLTDKLMSSEEAKKDRNEKIYWLGNMTLLTSSLNSSLRNYGFEKKMQGDGRKKGIKEYAELSITKSDIVSPFEKGDSNWDESKIINRTVNLTKEILNIWGIKGE